MQIEQYVLEDDGQIPNNELPLLIYREAFEARGNEGAAWLDDQFRKNNWSNSWRNGVFSYHHYHSNTHEVLGVYSGSAKLHMGGESGLKVEVQAGDVIIIPAGVGHKNLGSSSDFRVLGAYPNGSSYDLKTGKAGERPKADRNIKAVPLPESDPIVGKEGGLIEFWSVT